MRLSAVLPLHLALLGAPLAGAQPTDKPAAPTASPVARDPAAPLSGFKPIPSGELVAVAPGLRRVVIPAPKDTDYLYLHFKDITAAADSDLKLEIRNSSGLAAVWYAADLANRPTLLSPQLPAEDTIILVRGTANAADLTFTLDELRVLQSKPTPTALSPIYDYVPVSKTKPNDPVRQWARGVVKLTIGPGYMCTGFMVGPDLLVTNHHCVALSKDFAESAGSDRPCTDITFTFDYLDSKFSPANPSPVCKAVIDWEEPPVDLALIRLKTPPVTPPGVTRALKPATGASTDSAASADEPFQRVDLTGHPWGSRMKVSQGCRLYLKAKAGKLEHDCTTLGGSSGSPLLNAKGEVMAVHSDGWVDETVQGVALSNEYDRLCDLTPCPPRNTATPSDTLRAFLARPH